MKKNIKNTVDIIMPNYNKFNFLNQAIHSVIHQSYKNWKLYIIDDNSKDLSKNILGKFKKNKKINIYYLKQNKGPAFCRNFGIKKSSSNMIAFLDSDDFWPKNKLQTQLKFMFKNNIEFSFTDYFSFYQKNKKIKKIGKTNILKKFNFNTFIKNSSINTSTMIINRKILKNIRFKNLKKHEDYIFKCEIFKKNKGLEAIKFEKTFAHYRILQNSRSNDKLKSIYYLWKYNQKFNNLSFVKNFISLLSIIKNSIKKYGLKMGV